MAFTAPIYHKDSFFASNPTALTLLSLFEFIPGVIFYAKDKQGRFIAANTAMLQAKNINDPADFLGRSDRDFHPPALADAYVAEDQAVMAAREAFPNKIWFVIDPSGRPGWFNSSKMPLRNNRGRVIGIAGIRYAIETPEDRRFQFKTLAPVFKHLEEHYAEAVSMKEMATLAGLSSTHFNRSFAEMIGLSPTQFLHWLRIEKARLLLAQTSRDIATIAQDIGYHDQSHFTRHFRRLTGLTPRKYRMNFR